MKNFKLEAIDSYLECALRTAETEFDSQVYLDEELRYAIKDYSDAFGNLNAVIFLITLAQELFKEYCDLVPNTSVPVFNSDK